jgi:hypothetical protein
MMDGIAASLKPSSPVARRVRDPRPQHLEAGIAAVGEEALRGQPLARQLRGVRAHAAGVGRRDGRGQPFVTVLECQHVAFESLKNPIQISLFPMRVMRCGSDSNVTPRATSVRCACAMSATSRVDHRARMVEAGLLRQAEHQARRRSREERHLRHREQVADPSVSR